MRIAAIAATSLLIGAAAGYLLARPPGLKFDLAQELVSCEVGNTGMTLQALRALRTGKPAGAVSLLENGLSLHAVVLDE